MGGYLFLDLVGLVFLMDDKLKKCLDENGYLSVRELPNGKVAGIQQFIYTWGLCIGLDMYGIESRFCYSSFAEANAALALWDGHGFPPGYWIKQKPEDITGPGSKTNAANQ